MVSAQIDVVCGVADLVELFFAEALGARVWVVSSMVNS